jgi:hypothetical protein
VRSRLLIALLFAALAAATSTGTPPAAASCRTPDVRVHDEVVFGHFATKAGALALARRAKAVSFKGIKIEDKGCGDYVVAIGGADKTADRSSFAAEAAKAGFQVTFTQTGAPLTQTAKVTYGVFATFRKIAPANALAWKLATLNFRYIEVTYENGKWLVVMPQVPITAALSIAQEVHSAGYHVSFQV